MNDATKTAELCMSDAMPVNAIKMLHELENILKEQNTNSFLEQRIRKDWRARAILQTLFVQLFDGFFRVSLSDEYVRTRNLMQSDKCALKV